MKSHSFSRFLVMATALFSMAAAAHGQATRTWVSGVGDDANPCSRTAPCKTYAGAISKTAAGGEISTLDPGGYGSVTITKAITIDGGGGQVASTLASLVTGVTVNAGAGDRVVLRNLRIQGVGTGIHGVNFVAGKSLMLEKCAIQGFANTGINFQPASFANLTVVDSVVQDCDVAALVASTQNPENRVTLLRSAFIESGLGVKAGLNTQVSLLDSLVSNNSGGGVIATGNSLALMVVDRSVVSNNDGYGVRATANGIVLLTNSTVNFNSGNGLTYDTGGQILSAGQNSIAGNSGSEAPSGTIAPK